MCHWYVATTVRDSMLRTFEPVPTFALVIHATTPHFPTRALTSAVESRPPFTRASPSGGAPHHTTHTRELLNTHSPTASSSSLTMPA